VTETNVFQLSQPGTFSDPLTEVLAMPAIFGFREFAVAGGLMSYGGNIADSHIVILFEESELEIVECESAEAALATMLMGGRDVVWRQLGYVEGETVLLRTAQGGAADDYPSGIATYSQAGAQFGFNIGTGGGTLRDSRYGTLKAWAEQLGLDDTAELLQETLDEEEATDEALTEIAKSAINQEAEAAWR
jgi:uncharacterized protein DUF892